MYRETKNSPQYLGTIVDDGLPTNNLPVIRWFIQNASSADAISGTRKLLEDLLYRVRRQELGEKDDR